MPLLASEERFYLPAQLVDQGDLLGGEIEATGGNPVGFAFDRVADQSQRGSGLIDPLPGPAEPWRQRRRCPWEPRDRIQGKRLIRLPSELYIYLI